MDQLIDRQTVFMRQRQQRFAASIHVGRISGKSGLLRLIIARDESTAERKIVFGEQQLAVAVIGRKSHAIGVTLELLAEQENEIGIGIERDFMLVKQPEPARFSYFIRPLGNHVRVYAFRLLARQAQ